jgi:hypothetical protein
MNVPLKHANIAHAPEQPKQASLSAAMRSVAAKPEHRPQTVKKFPKRPHLNVLSETIPLFYICQNRHGFWVARDSERRNGGLFLRKDSALRFARKNSERTGCAMMLLTEPFELDVENQGSRVAVPLGSVFDVVTRRAPAFAAFVGMVVVEWHKLVEQISNALASERRHRAAIEQELFHGEYWLTSKNDDDLPIP